MGRVIRVNDDDDADLVWGVELASLLDAVTSCESSAGLAGFACWVKVTASDEEDSRRISAGGCLVGVFLAAVELSEFLLLDEGVFDLLSSLKSSLNSSMRKKEHNSKS